MIRRLPSLKTRYFLAATAWVVAAVVYSDPAAGSGADYSIRWVPERTAPHRVAAVVSGIDGGTFDLLKTSAWSPAQWRNLFAVYAEQGDAKSDSGLPAMLGTYEVKAGELWFRPQFPLEARVKYRAEFRPAGLTAGAGPAMVPLSSGFQLPDPSSVPATIVSQVYPTSPVIPENLLKFYLHFSAPMSRGHIYDYVHLRDERGKNVELPFLEIGEELWDPSMTRLTLFIDPGRIKRGVKPLEEIGPSLTAGHRYTLVIDRGWQDANGVSLKAGFERSYQISPPDRESLDPGRWKLNPPKSGTREALTIVFPKPVDHALAERVIQVTDPAGNLIEGKTVLRDAERQWLFTPDENWKRQDCQVVIQLTLEDLAGNNIGKPFEVDLFNGVQRRLTGSSVKLGFRVP